LEHERTGDEVKTNCAIHRGTISASRRYRQINAFSFELRKTTEVEFQFHSVPREERDRKEAYYEVLRKMRDDSKPKAFESRRVQ